MKTRTILAIILVTMGVIIAAVPPNKTRPYKLSAEQMLQEINSRTQFVSPDMVAEMLVNKDPLLRLIDIRSKDEFDKFSLPGAINIPLSDLLAPEYSDILHQDIKMNVLYSNGSVTANEAWMILRQLGYENNFVLEGGLNYWFDVFMNPQRPASTSPDEEFAKYDFRKSAGQALGGGVIVPVQEKSQQGQASAKPAVKPVPKKKKPAGGC